MVCEGKGKREKVFYSSEVESGTINKEWRCWMLLMFSMVQASFSSLIGILHCLVNPPSLMPTEVVESIKS